MNKRWIAIAAAAAIAPAFVPQALAQSAEKGNMIVRARALYTSTRPTRTAPG